MDKNHIENLKIRLEELEAQVAALRADLEAALEVPEAAVPVADDGPVDLSMADLGVVDIVDLPVPEDSRDEPGNDRNDEPGNDEVDEPTVIPDPVPPVIPDPVPESESEPAVIPDPVPPVIPASVPESDPEPPVIPEPAPVRPKGKSLVDLSAERLAWKTDFPGIRVKNIRSAISLIDRAQFIAKLFKEDYSLYDRTISELNEVQTFDEAVSYVTGQFPEWDLKSDIVYSFMMAIRKKLG